MTSDTASSRLPLHDQEGELVAYALVDADVFPALSRWSWCLDGGGYVVRGEWLPGGGTRKLKLHRVVMCCAVRDGTHVQNMANRTPRTHCIKGHEFTPENTRLVAGGRRCRTCQREWQTKANQRRALARAAARLERRAV